MLHVGVDLHKRQAQIAVMDGEGKVLTNRAVACEQEAMREFFASLGEPAEVVMEATSNWHWLCDLLEEMGVEVSLSHPLKTKAIASARIKTDKLDAATLAHMLRTNLLPRAHLASPQARLDRELLRHRAVLVRMRTGVKNRIHALLGKHNLVCTQGGLFTQKGRKWLARVELHPVERKVLDRLVSLVEMLDGLIQEASAEIDVRAQENQAARLLDTIPGIGYYSALLIVAEIDGVERFPDARHLCSYAGLVPSVRKSALRTHLGHITKQGSSWLRWILVELCQKAAGRSDFLGAHYRRVVRRKGPGAAKVATARKLLKAIYHMLKQGYDFSQVSQHMAAKRGASSFPRMAKQRPSH